MKAIPINIDGIQFRSKLEGKWYLVMKKLGWNIVYEPQIEGLSNWIPDFLIIGKDRKTLVDVKPIDTVKDWYKHPDRIRIEESGIKNLPPYELLILGTSLQLDSHDLMGLLYVRDSYWEEGNDPIHLQDYSKAYCVFSIVNDGKQIGFMDTAGSWSCRITGECGKTYLRRDGTYHNDGVHYRMIDKIWNEAGTQLQWNSPTSEHYLQDKKHPNSNQYCMDCENESVNYWKKTNLFYCTECRQVKPIFTWSGEPLKSPKYYAHKDTFFHREWLFYYATASSQEFQEKH